MPAAEALVYRKKAREIRLSESIVSAGVREMDLPQVFAKHLCLLTREGLDQIKNLPEWGPIEASSDALLMRDAIIKTHSTAMLAGTAQQSKYRSFREYMDYRMVEGETIHTYGMEFSTR